jgi:hypothetical protein
MQQSRISTRSTNAVLSELRSEECQNLFGTMPASSPVVPPCPARTNGRCEAASSSQAASSEMQAKKAWSA